MPVLYANRAFSTLASSITNVATSLSVAAGQGARFPAITAPDYFYATLDDNAGNVEIVKVTARSTDTFTIVRAQDGTSALAFNAGAGVELRVVKAMLDDFKTDTRTGYLPLAGGTMSGAITFAGGQTWPTFNQNTTGSAATLTTTRTLWGQNFNGSGNVSGNLTSVGNITGTAGVTLTATGGTLALAATGDNVITFATNGVERASIGGLGILIPNDAYFFWGAGDGSAFIRGSSATTDYISLGTSGSERMRLDASGNLGIGTTSPQRQVETYVAAGGNAFQARSTAVTADFGISSGNDFGFVYVRTNHFLAFGTNNVERARITGSGFVGIGTTSPAHQLVVSNGGAAGFEIGPTAVNNAPALISYNRSGGVYTQLTSLASLHAWHIGGDERMRLDSSGNLGIGTATPGARLAVDSGSAALAANFNSSNAGGVYTRFQNSGVSIGDIGAGGQLFSGGAAGDFGITSRSGSLIFGTATVERMRIDASGRVGINGTAPSDSMLYAQNVVGSAFAATFSNTSASGFGISIGTGSSILAYFYANGARSGAPIGSISCTSTTTSYNQSSDRRLKTAIAPATDAGALLDAVQVVEFDWKVGGHTRYGVIAQDLHLIVPEAVSPGDSNEEVKLPWGVDYSKLVPILIKEVQSLRARVAALEEQPRKEAA